MTTSWQYLFAISLTCLPDTSRADWNQWRGPERDGVVRQATPWPARLQADALAQRWRIELGPSYSGPLAIGHRIFVTESRDQAEEAAIALDRETGRQIWRTVWPGYQKVPFFARSNGDWIRATPALADGRLFVAGMRDVLVCLDAETGREIWRADFPRQWESPPPDFGFVSSPLVIGGSVYVQAGACFACLDAATGTLRWRTLADAGGMWGSAFSSPVQATFDGETQLLVQTRDKLAGVHPEDGRVLWEQPIKAFRGMNILTPVLQGDRLLTSAYGGKTQGWTLARAGDSWSVREAWSLRLEGYMTTPVVVDGHAFFLTRKQHLVCVDLAQGIQRWESDRKFGKYLSLVAQGKHLLALDQRGVLLLFEATPEAFRPLGEQTLAEDETWAHLAADGPDLVVRELNAVALWTWRMPPS